MFPCPDCILCNLWLPPRMWNLSCIVEVILTSKMDSATFTTWKTIPMLYLLSSLNFLILRPQIRYFHFETAANMRFIEFSDVQNLCFSVHIVFYVVWGFCPCTTTSVLSLEEFGDLCCLKNDTYIVLTGVFNFNLLFITGFNCETLPKFTSESSLLTSRT